jgi:tetratricopeptide (TPR) repeat protein
LFVILQLAAPCVFSQGDPLERARERLAASDAASAYALLAPLERERAGQPDFDYLLGIAALDSGEPVRAIFAFERVLAVQPGNALARAEIARAYLAAGEAETARGELAQVRAGAIPPAAVPAVDRLLNAISQLQAQQGTQWRGYLEAGLGYDSNVNSATGAGQIAVPAFGGALFVLDPASRRLHDRFAMIGGGGSVRVPLEPDLAFSANVAAAHAANAQHDRFDLGTLDANAGLSKTLGKDVVSAAVQASAAWVGGSHFRNAVGLYGQWQHNLSPFAQASVFAQYTRLAYPDQAVRDADRWVLGAGYARAIGNSASAAPATVFASGYAGREAELAAGAPHLGHELVGARAGVQWQAARVTWFATGSLERRDYGGVEPFFDRSRADRQSNLALGVHYAFGEGWRLTPQIQATDNDSNIPIYDYRRLVGSITLRREF